MPREPYPASNPKPSLFFEVLIIASFLRLISSYYLCNIFPADATTRAIPGQIVRYCSLSFPALSISTGLLIRRHEWNIRRRLRKSNYVLAASARTVTKRLARMGVEYEYFLPVAFDYMHLVALCISKDAVSRNTSLLLARWCRSYLASQQNYWTTSVSLYLACLRGGKPDITEAPSCDMTNSGMVLPEAIRPL